MTKVLSFSKPNQRHATGAANSVLNNGPIGNVEDVRELYAASRCAFAKDASTYEKQNVQKLILDRILKTRSSGVRRKSKTGNFEERDKLAGRKLFEKLEKLMSPQ